VAGSFRETKLKIEQLLALQCRENKTEPGKGELSKVTVSDRKKRDAELSVGVSASKTPRYNKSAPKKVP
jgi:hypothetical protein